jgi:hypothetical protein
MLVSIAVLIVVCAAALLLICAERKLRTRAPDYYCKLYPQRADGSETRYPDFRVLSAEPFPPDVAKSVWTLE